MRLLEMSNEPTNLRKIQLAYHIFQERRKRKILPYTCFFKCYFFEI